MSILKRFHDDGKEILLIPKVNGFSGKVSLIGSKSIANRVLYLASFCEEETLIHNVPGSEDVTVLLETLPHLGVEMVRDSQSPDSYRIRGSRHLTPGNYYFHLQNAGTALRPMVAILSTLHLSRPVVIDGNEQMRKRPIGDLVEALQRIGVEIVSENGYPPVTIYSGGWKQNRIFLSGKTSSQFLSALLLASPLAQKEIEIFITDTLVSRPYIDMTIRLMKIFSVEVFHQEYQYFRVPAATYKSPKEFFIEGDATAATYFYTAGLLSGPVIVEGIGKNSIQGDIAYLDIIEKLGGHVEKYEDKVIVSRKNPIQGLSISMNAMPDAAMTLAVTGLFASSPVEIYDIENLRVKETERIKALYNELTKLGAYVEEKKDGLIIHPPGKVPPRPRIETYKDHRMAMAFSLASYLTDIEIIDPDCVKKTFPNYFEVFAGIIR